MSEAKYASRRGARDVTSRIGVTRELEQRLREQRRALLRTLALTNEELAALEQRGPGAPVEDRATVPGDPILSRLEGREMREMDEIDDALARLAAGAYGSCESCGMAIPIARLRALPTARRCVGCQQKMETA